MLYWLVMAPLVFALLGWFLALLFIQFLFRPHYPRQFAGFKFHGLVPSQQFQLSARIGALGADLVSFDAVEEKLLEPSTLEKLVPEIETHIDHFLRVKLKDAMPMVAMFVGDKTIAQMKEVFMTEMKTLFPEIMKKYVKELQKDIDIREKITQVFSTLTPAQIESIVRKTFGKEIRYVKIAGALLGFILGAFQLIIILLTKP